MLQSWNYKLRKNSKDYTYVKKSKSHPFRELVLEVKKKFFKSDLEVTIPFELARNSEKRSPPWKY